MERSEGAISTYVYTGDCGRENIDPVIILKFNGYWNFLIFFVHRKILFRWWLYVPYLE